MSNVRPHHGEITENDISQEKLDQVSGGRPETSDRPFASELAEDDQLARIPARSDTEARIPARTDSSEQL